MIASLQRLTTREWMVGSLGIAVAILLISRSVTSVGGVDLRATARWSFILFWLGTTGGALARLFGPRFEGLARLGRNLSLAYASAHLVHLAIVARLIYTSPRPVPGLLFFGTAVFWTYLLAVLSIAKLSIRLNPTFWRIVRTVGVEYIALAFLVDFNKDPLEGGLFKVVSYLPFLLLAIAGPLLRLAAFVKRSVVKRRSTLVYSTRRSL